MTTPDRLAPEPGKDARIDEIQADIEQTREALGQTVEALSAKFDVKARAKHKAQDVRRTVVDQAHTVRDRSTEVAARAKDAATDDQGTLKPVLPASVVIAGAALALAAVLVWRHRR